MIITGIKNEPKKVVIYGPEGIGKSTFASKFPKPVFIDTEGSTKYLDVARFDKTEVWADLMVQIDEAVASDFKTLVVDTADWAELMCINEVCRAKCVGGIEDIGYGKGYVYVQEEFKKFLDKLDKATKQGMNVVVTAHAQMRKFEQPDEMGAYDRWEMKLSKKVAPMLKEWADMLLFANYQTLVIEDSKTKSKKAAGGARVMYATHHPCWDAKNRFGLPDKLEFSYDSIKKVIEGGTKERPKAKPAEEKPKAAPGINPIKEGEPEEIPFDAPGSAYEELKALMEKAKISDDEVILACVNKNLQAPELPVKDYPEAFIRDFLIAKFDGFAKYIKKNIKDVPFIQHYEEKADNKEEKK